MPESDTTVPSPFLAIIGGGTMARAILDAGFRAGVLTPSTVMVAEPDVVKHAELRRLGAQVCLAAAEAMAWLAPDGHVLLAIKPQSLVAVGTDLAPVFRTGAGGRSVISILAGTPIAKVESMLGGGAAVIRAMPNTPARIGLGATAYSYGVNVRPGNLAFARRLFGALGPFVIPIDESLMDAFTAVAGSGPAYVFYLAQAMEDAAVALGFDRAAASGMVRATLTGAGGLLAASKESPSALLAGVKSKGGTTEAAVRTLDASAVSETIIRAIIAARDRGAELSR